MGDMSRIFRYGDTARAEEGVMLLAALRSTAEAEYRELPPSSVRRRELLALSGGVDDGAGRFLYRDME